MINTTSRQDKLLNALSDLADEQEFSSREFSQMLAIMEELDSDLTNAKEEIKELKELTKDLEIEIIKLKWDIETLENS